MPHNQANAGWVFYLGLGGQLSGDTMGFHTDMDQELWDGCYLALIFLFSICKNEDIRSFAVENSSTL